MSRSPEPTIRARDALAAWHAARPRNFFTADPDLDRALRLTLDADRFARVQPRLVSAGSAAATVVDPAATINDRPGNHPRLERWSPIGERIESVEFHPSFDEAGRPIYESGVLALGAEDGHAPEQAALIYLFAQCGEAGHICPVVCTVGLIRALRAEGSPELQARYLPPLLDPSYDARHTGAQSLTEIQGGSDVGANAVRARPDTGIPGAWRIDGEKWFFSNATAEQILITARPEGAGAGTAGLGLFLVPRRLPDGSLNGIYLRRLKEKFGTRTMASAEVDFRAALAYPVGDLERGIHIVLERVLNISRWLNAVGSMAILRRAYVEAALYAEHREAFGAPIARYPLVQEALAEIYADLAGGLAATWRLTALQDRLDLGTIGDADRALYRLLVNLNKLRTSISASLGIRRAQEILGGNGAIEPFSVIPRLYRDAVVFESWEGSHNVLALQLLRDMRRYRIHVPTLALLRAELDRVASADLAPLVGRVLDALERTERRLGRLLDAEPRHAQGHVRRLLDELAGAAEAAFLIGDADRARARGIDPPPTALLHFFVDRHATARYDPLDDSGYLDRVAEIAGEGIVT